MKYDYSYLWPDFSRLYPNDPLFAKPIPLPYVPKVGDKVTLPTWENDRYVTVEWVGDKTFAGTRSSDGARTTYSFGQTVSGAQWQKWTEPKAKQYVVELRAPRAGESFVFQMDYNAKSHIITNASPDAGSVKGGITRPVIVGEQ